MNLYLISANTSGYNVYSSAVVAAETEQQAREQHPNGSEIWNGSGWQEEIQGHVYVDDRSYSWVNAPDVSVILLGTAFPSTPAGVICASFHAG